MNPEPWHWLAGYLSTGITLILLGRLIVKVFHKDERSEWVKATVKAIKGDKSPKEKRRQFFKDVIAGALIVLVWPIAFAVLIKELALSNATRELPEVKPPHFKSSKEALVESVNPLEVESESIVLDPLGRVPQLPFGHLNEGWRQLRAHLRPGDVLWRFATPGSTSESAQKSNRLINGGPVSEVKGYAIVRNGLIVHEFLIEWT